MDEAMVHFRRALEIQPDNAEAHYNVGVALADRGRFPEAMAHCRQALKSKPGKIGFQQRLAWMLATCPEASLRNGAEAVELAERVNQFYGGGRLGASIRWLPPTPRRGDFRKLWRRQKRP